MHVNKAQNSNVSKEIQLFRLTLRICNIYIYIYMYMYSQVYQLPQCLVFAPSVFLRCCSSDWVFSSFITHQSSIEQSIVVISRHEITQFSNRCGEYRLNISTQKISKISSLFLVHFTIPQKTDNVYGVVYYGPPAMTQLLGLVNVFANLKVLIQTFFDVLFKNIIRKD